MYNTAIKQQSEKLKWKNKRMREGSVNNDLILRPQGDN